MGSVPMAAVPLEVLFKGKLDYAGFQRALTSFVEYAKTSKKEFLEPRRSLHDSFSKQDRLLLAKLETPYLDLLKKLEEAINGNAQLAASIAQHAEHLLATQKEALVHSTMPTSESNLTPSPADHAIARATVRMFYRDWSSEGARERQAVHELVLRIVPGKGYDGPLDKSKTRILVPGAGLCRLPHTLATMGYDVEANEMSYHQLLASHFMLNNAATLPGFQLSPWALSFSNHIWRTDQFEVVTVPDALAQVKQEESYDGSKQGGKLVLNPAEFTTAYNSAEYASHFDFVVTMFFIDTAPNFLDYARTIRHTLKNGGCWINVGPLLWNCAENGPAGRGEGDADEDEAAKLRTGELLHGDGEGIPDRKGGKVELTHRDVIKLLFEMGFEVIFEDVRADEAGYVMDEKSMLKNVYQLAYWVVKKP